MFWSFSFLCHKIAWHFCYFLKCSGFVSNCHKQLSVGFCVILYFFNKMKWVTWTWKSSLVHCWVKTNQKRTGYFLGLRPQTVKVCRSRTHCWENRIVRVCVGVCLWATGSDILRRWQFLALTAFSFVFLLFFSFAHTWLHASQSLFGQKYLTAM